MLAFLHQTSKVHWRRPKQSETKHIQTLSNTIPPPLLSISLTGLTKYTCLFLQVGLLIFKHFRNSAQMGQQLQCFAALPQPRVLAHQSQAWRIFTGPNRSLESLTSLEHKPLTTVTPPLQWFSLLSAALDPGHCKHIVPQVASVILRDILWGTPFPSQKHERPDQISSGCPNNAAGLECTWPASKNICSEDHRWQAPDSFCTCLLLHCQCSLRQVPASGLNSLMSKASGISLHLSMEVPTRITWSTYRILQWGWCHSAGPRGIYSSVHLSMCLEQVLSAAARSKKF